jgi:hypothetical protein
VDGSLQQTSCEGGNLRPVMVAQQLPQCAQRSLVLARVKTDPGRRRLPTLFVVKRFDEEVQTPTVVEPLVERRLQ